MQEKHLFERKSWVTKAAKGQGGSHQCYCPISLTSTCPASLLLFYPLGQGFTAVTAYCNHLGCLKILMPGLTSRKSDLIGVWLGHEGLNKSQVMLNCRQY